MGESGTVFDLLVRTFGVRESERSTFLERYEKKRSWDFKGSVASGTISYRRNGQRWQGWRVVIDPEHFTPGKGRGLPGLATSVNRELEQIIKKDNG